MNKFMDNNQKIDDRLACLKKKCKCGHTQIVGNSTKRGYEICTHCGGRLYRDPKKQMIHDEKCKKENFRMLLNKYIKINNNFSRQRESTQHPCA